MLVVLSKVEDDSWWKQSELNGCIDMCFVYLFRSDQTGLRQNSGVVDKAWRGKGVHQTSDVETRKETEHTHIGKARCKLIVRQHLHGVDGTEASMSEGDKLWDTCRARRVQDHKRIVTTLSP